MERPWSQASVVDGQARKGCQAGRFRGSLKFGGSVLRGRSGHTLERPFLRCPSTIIELLIHPASFSTAVLLTFFLYESYNDACRDIRSSSLKRLTITRLAERQPSRWHSLLDTAKADRH